MRSKDSRTVWSGGKSGDFIKGLPITIIQFGLGWQRDDAEGKSRGIQTIIAGAIVMVAGGMAATFFA